MATRADGQQLHSVFPPGGEVGTTGSVTFATGGLRGLTAARCSQPGVSFSQGDGKTFTVQIDDDVPAGFYDVQAIGENGITSSRTFFVTNRAHVVEAEPKAGQPDQFVTLNSTVSGRITNGDTDSYRFQASRGDKLVIECWADRIDSSLRAMLELLDGEGRRLAINRGYFGIDPAIAFAIPSDGEYIIKLHDLVYSGSDNHFYRLDITTGPRVVFAVPPVVEAGKESQVELFGWNLSTPSTQQLALGDQDRTQLVPESDSLETASLPRSPPTNSGSQLGQPLAFESASVRIRPTDSKTKLPVHRWPASHSIDAFPYYFSNADVPYPIAVTQASVARARNNNSPSTAQPITVPVDVGGQLIASDASHWYVIEARRGEVLYIEAYGQRVGSPVDLDLSVFDSTGDVELASFHDELQNIGGLRYPSLHLDPAGRWVAPADGMYLISLRNLTGGIANDPRRVYRLSIRREEPDVRLVAIAHPESPTGINVSRGGRTVLDVLAFRRRGMDKSILVTARNLPPGVTCDDIWLGPGVTKAPLVLTADRDAGQGVAALDLVGITHEPTRPAREGDSKSIVQFATMIHSGLPNGSGRLATDLPFAVADHAPIRITADGHESRDHQLYGELQVRHAPGGVIDVAVRVERTQSGHTAPVKLTAIGLPDLIRNQIATIPAGQDKGYISFYLPHSLPVGMYSFAIKADSTVPVLAQAGKTQNVTVQSNTITFEVHPPAFQLDLALDAPRRIKRGQIAQINYSVRRINGFISKIHTELAAPGRVTDVGRLRGRGVTSVGQAESGTIQIIANDDAELGQIPFLRLYAVGVLEDEALYHGSCFLPLEIVE